MKKTALLIDAGWFLKGLADQISVKWPSAKQVCTAVKSTLLETEDLYRIFYYDCRPFDGTVTNPISGASDDFTKKPAFAGRNKFLDAMEQEEFVALRLGELKMQGWDIRPTFKNSLQNGAVSKMTEDDMHPNFKQKGVDMKIGIDVASLAFKRIVDRIVLFSNDADMIPAMKLARREGVQIFLAQLTTRPLTKQIVAHSDGIRKIEM
jgi:uncharacterized LabA/DUF88 family protein